MTTTVNPATKMNLGYLHPGYPRSSVERGSIVALDASGGFLIERTTPHGNRFDARHCAPFLCCAHWDRLADDLAGAAKRWVTITCTTDPLAHTTESMLLDAFDCVEHYKPHCICDLRIDRARPVSAHHRRELARAWKVLRVEPVTPTQESIATWQRLYGHLATKKKLARRFAISWASMQAQLRVPGAVLFQASDAQGPCGMSIWMDMGKTCYYHLSACDDRGYHARAGYAMVDFALDYFKARGVETACLGSGPGLSQPAEGVMRFKRGFSTREEINFMCKKIADPASYEILCGTHFTPGFFPAYRHSDEAP